MHAPRQPRPVLATLVMPDEGQDVQESGGTDAVTEARRVVEPDLLWIESVTDRLLGTAGRPAAWERVYFEGRETAAPAAGDEPPAAEPHADESAEPRATEPDVGEQPAAGPDDEPLPQRAPRVFGGPVSYRQPAGYVPPASVDVLTMPPPVDDPSA
ncbi:MAG: hypothetical protein ACRDTP_03485, partial [Mycobacteriales bacterium]